jgi:uncharacterized protein
VKRLRRVIVGVVIAAAIGYGAAVAYMYFKQRDMQYSPAGEMVALADTTLTAAEEVSIPTTGGAMLGGWFAPPAEGKPVILFYKGNAGTFSEEHERFERFTADGYGFLAFDYRGFPASPGEITQTNMLEDSVAAFDWLAAKGYPIVIWGRSIGSGPATYVASVREANALLLETPFLSAVTVAAERYPYLPVALVMLDQFPSNQWILDVEEPVFIAHGTGDTTIGVSNGERLYKLAPNPGGIWIEPGAGHSDLWKLGIWNHAEPFFAGLEGASAL